MQSKNIFDSIARAKEFHDIDESSILVLDANRATWLAYVYIDERTKVLFFCQYDKEVALSEIAERNLRNWFMSTVTG